MKILYITSSWFLDGDFPLIKQLIKNGIDVKLCIKVYTHSLNSTVLELKKAYQKIGIFDSSIYGDSIDRFKEYLGINNIFVINHTHGDNSWRNIIIENEELRLIKRYKPDIIHYIGWPSIYEIPILLRYGKKIITTVHDPVPHEITKKAMVNQKIRRLAYKSINRFILLNNNQTEEFQSFYNVKKKKILFSRLGNFDIIKAFGSKSNTNTYNILFFGRISPYKGVEYLLKAYSSLMKDYPNTKLIVAGGGNYHFDISIYMNNPQIEIINEYISTDKLSTLIQDSEFIVCPYISATQSGVVASALALNKPVIATKVGGIPEMITDGKTGLLIEPKNVDSLKSAIKSFLDNPNLVKFMSNNIKQLAIDGPNAWSKIVLDYIKLYKDFLKNEKGNSIW